MGVRPRMVQVLGVKVPNAITIYNDVLKQFSGLDLWQITKEIWDGLENDEDLVHQFQSQFECMELSDMFEHYTQGENSILCVKMPYQLQDAELYNHSLIWAMLESGFISSENRIIRIPYDDWSIHCGSNARDISRSIGAMEAKELKRYTGSWYRKYSQSTLDYFDYDLTFADFFFKKIGLDIKPIMIDRYFIFEWC